MKKILTLDLETSSVNTFGKFANPFDMRNVVTCIALKSQDHIPNVIYSKTRDLRISPITQLKDVDVVIGQNIAFDLKYFWKNSDIRDWLAQGGQIYDTMLAEYLITGQRGKMHQSLSLNTLSKKYGGTLKDDEIGAMFKQGILARDIDTQKLITYAKYDVENTELVYLGQEPAIKKKKLASLISVYCRQLLAICEMEYNGLHIDKKIASKNQGILEGQAAACRADCLTYVDKARDLVGWSDDIIFSPESNEHVSVFIFGGKLPVILDKATGEYYKTGKRAGEAKTRKEKEYRVIPGLGCFALEEWKNKKEGIYKVDDEVLKYIAEKNKTARGFIECLLKLRSLNKLISTYYYKERVNSKGEITTVGILSKLFPKTSTLHTDFRQCATETGRLSSSGPNVQNLPKEILDMFTSRYGKDGVIVEVDLSQIEVCLAAYLAQDVVMLQEIEQGLDLHRRNAAYVFDKTEEEVTADERKQAKAQTFAIIYGAHPKTEEDERFYKAFYEKYYGLREWHNLLEQEIRLNASPTDQRTNIRDKQTGQTFQRPGEVVHESYTTSPTGKRYYYTDAAVLTKRGDVFRYWPTPAIKNYPVQGLAADLMHLVTAKVYEWLRDHEDKGVLVNEVHDAVILDVKKEHVDLISKKVLAIMSNIDVDFKELFDIDLNVPIRGEAKWGESWLSAKEG